MAAWDGKEWFTPSYAPLDPPPYFVHVLIQAAAGTEPPAVAGLRLAKLARVRDATDALLNPSRAQAVSLGWVRWYAHRGQLILEPTDGQSGGEVAGHLIFRFAANGVDYVVTLHAWAAKIRLTSRGTRRVVSAPQLGPALPHVIATLKAIVGSALRR